MAIVFEKRSDFDQPLFRAKSSVRSCDGQDLEFGGGEEKTDGSEVVQGCICIYKNVKTRFC